MAETNSREQPAADAKPLASYDVAPCGTFNLAPLSVVQNSGADVRSDFGWPSAQDEFDLLQPGEEKG